MYSRIFWIVELAIFWLLAFALLLQLAMSVYRLRRNHPQISQQRLQRRQKNPKWLNSGIFFFLTAIAFIFLGTMTAYHGVRWRTNSQAARLQKALPIELHIAGVSPLRTYTVVAKFRIHGRAYQSSPLKIKFGEKKSGYSLTLYYNQKNPARNSWNQLGTSRQQDKFRAIGYAIGLLLCAMILLDWLELRFLQNRSTDNPSNSSIPQHG